MWGQGSGGVRRIHRIPGFAGVVLFIYKLVLRGRGGGDQDRRTEGHGKDLHETCGTGWKVGPALPVEIGARVP